MRIYPQMVCFGNRRETHVHRGENFTEPATIYRFYFIFDGNSFFGMSNILGRQLSVKGIWALVSLHFCSFLEEASLWPGRKGIGREKHRREKIFPRRSDSVAAERGGLIGRPAGRPYMEKDWQAALYSPRGKTLPPDAISFRQIDPNTARNPPSPDPLWG